MRIGSAKDGKVTAFIPDPTSVGETFSMVDGKPVMKKADGSPGTTGTLAAEGVAVDAAGNIYGAEVGPRAVKKYVKKSKRRGRGVASAPRRARPDNRVH